MEFGTDRKQNRVPVVRQDKFNPRFSIAESPNMVFDFLFADAGSLPEPPAAPAIAAIVWTLSYQIWVRAPIPAWS